MLVYGIFVGITFLLYAGLRYGLHYEKAYVDRVTISFFFVLYLLLLCFRDVSIGVDLKTYIWRFQQLQMMDWPTALSYSGKGDEFAFILLNKVVGIVGGPRLLIIVASVIIVLPIMYLYKNESEGAFFTISFFLVSLLFGFFFSAMRQSIAIALAVPAYYYTKNKKIIPYLLIVALAFLCHRSAILLVLLFPIYHAKITRKWLWVVVPLMVLLFFYRDIVFSYITLFVNDTVYVNYNTISGSSGQGLLSVLFILLSVYSLIVLDAEKAGPEEIGLRNILLLATCLHMFSPFNPVFGRINLYFILFIPVAITRINNRCKPVLNKAVQIASFLMSVVFILHFLTSTGSSVRIENYKLFF